MRIKPFFLVLAAVLLFTVLCVCRPPAKEETAQSEPRSAEPAEQKAQTQERDGPQETEDTGRPDEAPDSQPEESPPVEATQEDEISEPEAIDSYEVEIDENQGTGGL